MKKKFISVETFVSASGERFDLLCRDHATVDELMAILQLCPLGGSVTISVNEEEISAPPFSGFVKEENA